MKFINIRELSTGTSLINRKQRVVDINRKDAEYAISRRLPPVAQQASGHRCVGQVATTTNASIAGSAACAFAQPTPGLASRTTACFSRDYHSVALPHPSLSRQ